MTQPKTRSDSLTPVPSASFAATGRSLIPPPAQAPPDEAAAAYAQVEAELVALTDDAVETRRVDAVAAAGKARKMADEILADAALVERFRKVAASGEFAMRSLERLATYGLALWHAAYQQGSTTPAGRRNLPEALRAKARTVRERMQKLVEYHFGAHPDEATVVANLVAMRSDRGLAQVLVGFADLYARHPAVVTTDATYYRPTDAANARSLAQEIRDALDADPAHWGARTARAWTLLVRAYNDVQATGLWMFRATPVEGARRFPSLIAESRAPARRTAAKTDDAGATPGTTTGVPPATDTTKPARPTAPKRRRRTR
jgi:hypothetical protein